MGAVQNHSSQSIALNPLAGRHKLQKLRLLPANTAQRQSSYCYFFGTFTTKLTVHSIQLFLFWQEPDEGRVEYAGLLGGMTQIRWSFCVLSSLSSSSSSSNTRAQKS